MTPPHSPEEWVTVALLGKTRGNRGELTAVPLGKPERFEDLAEVWLFGEGARYEVESTWFHGEILILKFRGVDTISGAERLTGAEVRIPRSQRAPLPEGEVYQSDLVGCQVVDRNGREIGQVTGFSEAGGIGLLEVGPDLLIPFARAICFDIDLAARRIRVDLPAGLQDLNRP